MSVSWLLKADVFLALLKAYSCTFPTTVLPPFESYGLQQKKNVIQI